MSPWSRANAPTTTTAIETTALLLVEIADTSLPQDRLTKSRIYAAAGIRSIRS